MLIAKPSIFSSHTYVTASSGSVRATRDPQASSSSRVIALSRLIIGTAWLTGAKRALADPPTSASSGLSTSTSGCAAMSAAQLAHEGIEIAVGDLRIVELVVALVVVADEVGEGDQPFRRVASLLRQPSCSMILAGPAGDSSADLAHRPADALGDDRGVQAEAAVRRDEAAPPQ